jgi:hypothetical protein
MRVSAFECFPAMTFATLLNVSVRQLNDSRRRTRIMRREDLERYLEKGDTLGFEKETGTDEYLGWILLTKQKPHDRYLSLLAPGEEPEFVAKQEMIRQKPYQVLIQELKKEVHESDRYETNEDFRINECYYFANVDEVEEFVRGYGHTLQNIKWPVEIDAP